jgi:halimadienyl-diphosphate synthase
MLECEPNRAVPSFLSVPLGLTAVDAMSTARVALVPAAHNLAQPAWPQSLDVLRRLQLPDGSWGEPNIYNAYDRFGCTLAALRTLLEWHQAEDAERIGRGQAVLSAHARDMQREVRDLVGFEFITDRLLQELNTFGISVDDRLLGSLASHRQERLMQLGSLDVDPRQPRSWWFSLECLPEATLARVDPSLVSVEGGIVTSTCATAAYLRAMRRAGGDHWTAARYLEGVVEQGCGGAGFCWPLDNSQLIWSIDAYLKIGVSPSDPLIQPSIAELYHRWKDQPDGIGLSPYFPVRDGDDIAMGYSVLRRAGYDISDAPLLACWNGRALESYPGERVNAVSVNIHALYAVKENPHRGAVHDQMVAQILAWLHDQFQSCAPLVDPWHISPAYLLGRGLFVFVYYDRVLAQLCTDRLLDSQRENGGWGFVGACTEEETALAVIGLISAREAGLLSTDSSLRRAARFLSTHHTDMTQRPGLWLAKTLYLPVNMVEAFVQAAQLGLNRLGLGVQS